MKSNIPNESRGLNERSVDPNARLAATLACAAIGAILALVILAIYWPAISALVYGAVIAVGATAGGAIGVARYAVRRKFVPSARTWRRWKDTDLRQ
jgi:hypothetical protein